MSVRWSPVLCDVIHAVQLNAPVLVTYDREDAVLAAGRVVSLRAGVRLALEDAGFETVAWVDRADGICPIGANHAQGLRALHVADGLDGWPLAVRGLLAATARPTAAVLKNISLLLDSATDPGGVAHIVAAAAGAVQADGGRSSNALIMFALAGAHVPADLRALPGLIQVTTARPSEGERLATLRTLAYGFHGAAEVEPAVLAKQMRDLATVTAGFALAELEQLRQESVRSKLEPAPARRLVRALQHDHGSEWMARRHRTPAEVRTYMSREIVGQPAAVEQLVQAVDHAQRRRLTASPAASGGAPRGVLLLTGASATGKTEASRALARLMMGSEDRLIRIDCGQLKLSQDVAALTGARPGYVGFGTPVALAARVRELPASIVVFDEVDKCHPDVLDVLLAILEEGQLADGSGQPISFSETFIILTTNFGAHDVLAAARAGEAPERVVEIACATATHVLSAPEHEGGKGKSALVSRIGAVCGFDVLRRSALPDLTAKLGERAEQNLADEGLDVRVDVPAFVEVLDRVLPDDGFWHGRDARRAFDALATEALTVIEERGPINAPLTLKPLPRVVPVTSLRRESA